MSKEKRLIRKIVKHGSKQAANELVDQYYDDLYRYLYYQVSNREDALDLTQEAFIAALSSLATYDSKKAGFRTWLFRIGTYKVIDFRRKDKLPWVTLIEIDWVEADELAINLAHKELLVKINQAVSYYHPAIQEIFQLRVYGQLAFNEIAMMQNEKEEKIKAQYYRLIKKIREEFGQHVR